MSTKGWTKEQEIALINKTQDEYIDELIQKIKPNNKMYKMLKNFNFTSPTGTGKTNMMSKLINKLPDTFFIITSPSRGSLSKQISTSLTKLCEFDNYIVYGTMSYTKKSILQDDDILSILPENKPIFWLRDEGHINTTRWTPLLEEKCQKIINFSATNKEDAGIVCNFTHTMMLRTVQQQEGTIEDAISKLKEVKKLHKSVKNYNPCAIFRVVNSSTGDEIEKICKSKKLKVISIVDNDDFDMEDLCKDDNKYDVIINKQKIVEGIDIRRAHVVWLENQPNNVATTIQFIGRCRRNALLWRDDIDILSKENEKLLNDTRQCYVYYNKRNMKIDQDETGELAMAFCPYVSVQKLKCGHTIYVKNGQMKNGLHIIELEGKTGYFEIKKDEKTGFNIIDNEDFYSTSYNNAKIGIALPDNKEFYKNLSNDINLHFIGNSLLTDKYTLNDNGSINHEKVFPVANEQGFLIKETQLLNDDYFIKNGQNKLLDLILSKKCIHKWEKITTIKIENNEDTIIDISDIKGSYSEMYLAKCTKPQKEYKEIYNDKLLSIIGVDEYRALKVKNSIIWIPDNGLYRKLSRDTKLNAYISNIFEEQILEASKECFAGKNQFEFDKKRNSCLGYCVEYYAKYLLFGCDYLNPYITTKDLLSCETDEQKTAKIVRACMDKYKELMKETYGDGISSLITAISEKKLLEKENEIFAQTIVELGTRTYNFIKDKIDVKNTYKISPILNTKHIKGLVDIMSEDTIIDIKCTNHINETMIKQVFAYYFLSSYRHDVNIKKLIIYDAVSNRSIQINVDGLLNKQTFIKKPTKQNTFSPITICYDQTTIDKTIRQQSEKYFKQERLSTFLHYCKEIHNTNIVSRNNCTDIENTNLYDWLIQLNENNTSNIDTIKELAKNMYLNSVSRTLSAYKYNEDTSIENTKEYLPLFFASTTGVYNETTLNQIKSNWNIYYHYLNLIFKQCDYWYHPCDDSIQKLQNNLLWYEFPIPKINTFTASVNYTKTNTSIFGDKIFEIILNGNECNIYKLYATEQQMNTINQLNKTFFKITTETLDNKQYAILKEIHT